jgi:endonuclease/exonuclease/phosphatase (EEP) superfamily protein YafD
MRNLVVALAVGYPIALVSLWVALRHVGEAWWVTTAALYLPRVIFAFPLPILAIALWAYRMRRLLWAQAFSLLLLVFPVMGFVLPWPVFARPGAPSVRVASLNVDSGHAGPDAIVDAIARYSPDVVLLVETAGNEGFLAPLRARYPTVEASGQFLLATRFPLVRTVEPDKLLHDGHARSPRFIEYVLDTPLGPVAFYGVHPISPREGLATLRGQGLRGEIRSGRIFEGASARVLESNTDLRTLQVQAIAEAAALETVPVVVAGDTNLPDPSPLLRRALGEYADAFTAAGWGFGYTFPTNKWRPWMRIDRIMTRGGLRFTHFEIGKPTVSDHHLLVADLQRSGGSM